MAIRIHKQLAEQIAGGTYAPYELELRQSTANCSAGSSQPRILQCGFQAQASGQSPAELQQTPATASQPPESTALKIKFKRL